MADSQIQPNQDDLLSMERLRELVQLMEEHELGEVELCNDDQSVRIQRGFTGAVAPARAISASTSAPPSPAPHQAEAGPQAAEDENIAIIKSPMVGTFYAKPNPDAESFAKVGDHVGPETTVCIIEAMKVFNEIPAEVSGRIVAVMVENEEPVEYGKPLFKVDKNG